MDEINFRAFLSTKKSKKIVSDNISRLKAVEREMVCDIDREFQRDRCENLTSRISFLKNKHSSIIDIKLPIHNYQINNYKHAIKLYIMFKDDGGDKNE